MEEAVLELGGDEGDAGDGRAVLGQGVAEVGRGGDLEAEAARFEGGLGGLGDGLLVLAVGGGEEREGDECSHVGDTSTRMIRFHSS